MIAVGNIAESGTVLVLDWIAKKWLPNIGDESDNIQAIDCNSDASQIAIGTTARTLKTFDRMTQKELHVHRKHTNWVTSVSYSPDGLVLASGDRFGGLHVWETETGNEFATLRGHSGGITGLVWGSDGNQLTSVSLDGSVRIWNMHTLETEKQWIAHERGVLSIASRSESGIVTTGRDGWIRIWSPDTFKVIGKSKLPDEAIGVCCLSSSPDSNALVGTDAAGGIYRLNRLETHEEDLSVTPVLFSVSNQKRMFASIAPTTVKRTIEPAPQERIAESSIASTMGTSNSDSGKDSSSDQSNPPILSDLEESRRALASVEQSLEQTYRNAEQLEESVARLKQLIALQEARIKQAELRQKSSRKQVP